MSDGLAPDRGEESEENDVAVEPDLNAELFYGLGPVDGLVIHVDVDPCLLYTSPSPRDRQKSRMPSSA